MENSLPGWTESWQGVRQLWPKEVFASAPGGSDAMASVSDCGADLRKSRLGIVAEHAASIRPQATTAITRLMIPPGGNRRRSPRTRLQRHVRPVRPRGASLAAVASALNCPKCGAHKVKYGLTLLRGSGNGDA